MRLLLLVCLVTLSWPAFAQQKEPLEITADESLEWHRTEKLYIARKNAVAKQGPSELHGDTLTATYTEGEKDGGIDISRIDAQGNVLVISGGSKATGQKGFYDIKTGYSELTGGNLKLETPTDVVTARDKITYLATSKEMNAYGQAKAIRGDDVITSDRLIGRFIEDGKTGGSKLSELEAIGNVVITTPKEVLYGEQGTYNAITNIATITGNVRIQKGPSYITGSRGEVDLNTNISRMFGTSAPTTENGTDGRVRGVFFPE
ncbi:MAG: ostA-like family protein [Proteobacteria bacterium]|nr:ostA-like family protein [Pseudomonadota bacterium]